MKIISIFETLVTLTSSSENASFPDDNIKDLDPLKRWWASSYSGEAWLKINFGAAKTLSAAFLNQGNFPQCRIQGNSSDAWVAPPFDLECDLVVDDAKNRKGWFDLTAFSFQWLRILIPPGQTLDNSDTVPKLGNLIVGAASTLPLVSELDPTMIQRKKAFETNSGGYRENKKGRARHVITMGIGDSLTNIRAMPKTWDIAVIFADLGNAGESWLVYPPENWSRPIKSIIDAQLRFTLKERP